MDNGNELVQNVRSWKYNVRTNGIVYEWTSMKHCNEREDEKTTNNNKKLTTSKKLLLLPAHQ